MSRQTIRGLHSSINVNKQTERVKKNTKQKQVKVSYIQMSKSRNRYTTKILR